MRYVLYTTTSSAWYREKAKAIAARYSANKNRGECTIDVVKVSPPRNPVMITDADGDHRFAWDWIMQRFPKGDYDRVAFHFTNHYRDRWGVASGTPGKKLNGAAFPVGSDGYFWFCCDREMAEGYDGLSEIERLFIHEDMHIDENLDDGTGNKLAQQSVHIVDYQMKAIHRYHEMVDYRGYHLKRKVNRIINRVIDLVRHAVPNS